MDNMDKQLEEIKQIRTELYRVIIRIIDNDISEEEIRQFLSMSTEDKKQWTLKQMKRLEVQT